MQAVKFCTCIILQLGLPGVLLLFALNSHITKRKQRFAGYDVVYLLVTARIARMYRFGLCVCVCPGAKN